MPSGPGADLFRVLPSALCVASIVSVETAQLSLLTLICVWGGGAYVATYDVTYECRRFPFLILFLYHPSVPRLQRPTSLPQNEWILGDPHHVPHLSPLLYPPTPALGFCLPNFPPEFLPRLGVLPCSSPRVLPLPLPPPLGSLAYPHRSWSLLRQQPDQFPIPDPGYSNTVAFRPAFTRSCSLSTYSGTFAQSVCLRVLRSDRPVAFMPTMLRALRHSHPSSIAYGLPPAFVRTLSILHLCLPCSCVCCIMPMSPSLSS